MKTTIELMPNDYAYFDGGFGYKVKRTTEKAVLIIVNRGDNVERLFDIWLPKKCFNPTRSKKYDDGTREIYCGELSSWALSKIKGI